METLEMYQAVNACETYEDLANVIETYGNEHEAFIHGRTIAFDANKMAENCRNFNTIPSPNLLTRRYGIRQQALYIQYYENK